MSIKLALRGGARCARPILLLLSILISPAAAQFRIEDEPIRYNDAPHTDPAGVLSQRLEQRQTHLAFQPRLGYLPAVLKELGISETSQVLVFSKTSFQKTLIAPKRPRAIYFNDDSYVGCVQGGEVLELASVDPRLGTMFYTLAQEAAEAPKLVRQHDDCLQCHASSMTENVPGLMVRSVFPNGSGSPVLSAGSFRTSYQSPLRERWGGWYVTGTHGRQRHMGNAILRGGNPDELDREKGANVTDLSGRFDASSYLTPHSDIVALMVLEHQVFMHNLLTLASYQAMLARQEQEALNKMDGKPADAPIEGIERRYRWAGDAVLRGLLFVNETRLTDPVRGTSGFAEHFAARGPLDRRGRSLRQFDLQTRLFKYPCSYLIYSAAFDKLPEPVKQHIYRRLHAVLTGKEVLPELAHWSPDDRRAAYEILLETKADLPAYWKTP